MITKLHRHCVPLLIVVLVLGTAGCKHKHKDHDAGAKATEVGEGLPSPRGTEEAEGSPSAVTKLLADIHFDFDKADVRAEARPTLEQDAAVLKKYATVKVVVEGHCDERGSVEYNLALGDRRAKVAREYLVRLGIDGGRLTTVSYGKEQPLDPGHDEDAWAKNRRAHFLAVSR